MECQSDLHGRQTEREALFFDKSQVMHHVRSCRGQGEERRRERRWTRLPTENGAAARRLNC